MVEMTRGWSSRNGDHRIGSQASAKGAADWFTGSVRIDSPFQPQAPARIGGATVSFEPGAIEDIRAGDIIWFGPGEKHWHGASPTPR